MLFSHKNMLHFKCIFRDSNILYACIPVDKDIEDEKQSNIKN